MSVAFAVNILITPADALLTEMTNEAIRLVPGQDDIGIVANLYFGMVSTIFVAIVATIVTERYVEKRLGRYTGTPSDENAPATSAGAEKAVPDTTAEGRGLRFAGIAALAALAAIALLTFPENAPLREPETGDIIGTTPFMDSLIFMITLIFLAMGVAYGIGAKTIHSANDVVAAVVKTFSGLSGLIFMLLIISQFIAHFNFSNMPQVIAVGLADLLESMDIGAIPLLIGFIIVIAILDIIIPGVLPKWAIFAPIFIPLFIRLDVSPQTVLAAYRIGDSPMNVITPLMVYLPFILIVAQRYQKDAGIGTILSLMIPYTIVVLVTWVIFFVLWYVIGIPLGPGYPVKL